MATQQDLNALQNELRPLVEAAIARGEDLSSPADMERFVERVLEQGGYVLRDGIWLQPNN